MTTFDAEAAYSLLEELTTPRPLAEYHEDMGDVLWWRFDGEQQRWAGEPPYVGTPVDQGMETMIRLQAFNVLEEHPESISRIHVGGWPGYHTHFTPLPPMPKVPR